jgi:predicted acyl esterase
MKCAAHVAALFLAVANLALAQADLDLGPVTERHEMIPMRDGQRLSAYLYLPTGTGPWPAVFEQRYADLRAAGTRKAAARLAEAGYVVALVNFRGTHLSEGTWVGYRALGWGDLQDGYDTCEWLAKQPWCTGNVGTFGSSQGGYAQNFLAVTRPPHLKCQYMVDTGLSLFQEGYRIGGITRPNRFLAMASNCRNPDDNRRLLEEWFRHPNYDDYWKQEDCSLHFDKMNVPCFTIGSWFDFMNQGSIASFVGRQHHGGPNSRGKQQLVIGPWLHGRLNKTNKVGDLIFPENAIWPEQEHMVRWFDHYLKDKENGVEREPAVRYYAMGAVGESDAPGNVWRNRLDWPPRAAGSSLYLQAKDGLTATIPTEDTGSTSYFSDPRRPMQIPGTAFPGAKDAQSFEIQGEVLSFTTARLTEPVEWTGRVRAELYVSSTARDTDFIVRVSDVYPSGRSILLCDYPWRARYREGFDHEALLEPGQVHKIEFDVGWISHIFNSGHKIRVAISSTGAPLYEPNPQTGGPLTIEFPSDAVKAENKIHHNRAHPSRIIFPDFNPKAIEPFAQNKSSAVFVKDVPLIYTAQLLPRYYESQGQKTNADSQLLDVLFRLTDATGFRGIENHRVVKLNFYVAQPETVKLIEELVMRGSFSDPKPAVSVIVTPLAHPDALVALDAIAVSDAGARTRLKGSADAVVVSSGSRLYISGQAEKADTLREATRKTLESLSVTLKHCGRSDVDVVQVKCFLQPMSSVAEVKEEIARYYGKENLPLTCFVEWKATSPPIEIEVVAWGGPANNDADEALEFITPPGMTASPVFSRVARINRGPMVFIGDIASPTTGSADEQMQASFDVLSKLLAKTGSDFQHLAKATYYVTDDEISKAHNAIRPKFYDPTRPPSASKALIQSTGHNGSRYVMEMIAVPSEAKNQEPKNQEPKRP